MEVATDQKVSLIQEIAKLSALSPSFNALPLEKRQKLCLTFNILPEKHLFEIKDMFENEAKAYATAHPKDLNEMYLKLKEIYATLQGIKHSREVKALSEAETSSKQSDQEGLETLEDQLNNI